MTNNKKHVVKPIGEEVLLEGLEIGTPQAIENQEARGQQSFVSSDTLPIKFQSQDDGWKILESFGIQKLENADDLFTFVQLPEEWKKVSTDHSMWSHLLDEKNRIRARIFYKAAFYDRDAFMFLVTRFNHGHTYLKDYSDKTELLFSFALDGEKEIWRSEGVTYKSDKAEILAAEWLNENYPSWKDITAYWNEE